MFLQCQHKAFLKTGHSEDTHIKAKQQAEPRAGHSHYSLAVNNFNKTEKKVKKNSDALLCLVSATTTVPQTACYVVYFSECCQLILAKSCE